MYMQYYVTITSQGQITIPAPVRRQFGLEKGEKVVIRTDEGRAVIEPAKDIFALRGVFASKKRFTRKQERHAAELAWALGGV